MSLRTFDYVLLWPFCFHFISFAARLLVFTYTVVGHTGGGGILKNFLYGGLRPEVQTLTPIRTLFYGKDNIFIYIRWKMVALSHTYRMVTTSLSKVLLKLINCFGVSVRNILKVLLF